METDSFGQYVTNQATRIIVRAAGELASDTLTSLSSSDSVLRVIDTDFTNIPVNDEVALDESEAFDIDTYRPLVREDRSWSLSEIDLGECTFVPPGKSVPPNPKSIDRMDRRRVCGLRNRRRRYTLSTILDGPPTSARR